MFVHADQAREHCASSEVKHFARWQIWASRAGARIGNFAGPDHDALVSPRWPAATVDHSHMMQNNRWRLFHDVRRGRDTREPLEPSELPRVNHQDDRNRDQGQRDCNQPEPEEPNEEAAQFSPHESTCR